MRCFVAIPVPAAVAARLAFAHGGIPGARWTDAQQLHLTLTFLGELESGHGLGRLDSVSDIVDAVARARGEHLELRLGEPQAAALTGRTRAPRILWVRLQVDQGLLDLHDRLLRNLRAAGFTIPRERFTPHVTLARLRDADPVALTRWIEGHGRWDVDSFDAEGIGVYTSMLHPDGARHHLRSWHPLPTRHPRSIVNKTATNPRVDDASAVQVDAVAAERFARRLARRRREARARHRPPMDSDPGASNGGKDSPKQ